MYLFIYLCLSRQDAEISHITVSPFCDGSSSSVHVVRQQRIAEEEPQARANDDSYEYPGIAGHNQQHEKAGGGAVQDERTRG